MRVYRPRFFTSNKSGTEIVNAPLASRVNCFRKKDVGSRVKDFQEKGWIIGKNLVWWPDPRNSGRPVSLKQAMDMMRKGINTFYCVDLAEPELEAIKELGWIHKGEFLYSLETEKEIEKLLPSGKKPLFKLTEGFEKKAKNAVKLVDHYLEMKRGNKMSSEELVTAMKRILFPLMQEVGLNSSQKTFFSRDLNHDQARALRLLRFAYRRNPLVPEEERYVNLWWPLEE
ncbi:hypothetical protein HZB89_01990 [archaeon]|nr:hypothetical protein [archaeon]